jgi:hypothetical protein
LAAGTLDGRAGDGDAQPGGVRLLPTHAPSTTHSCAWWALTREVERPLPLPAHRVLCYTVLSLAARSFGCTHGGAQMRLGVRGDEVGWLSEAEAAEHAGAATATVVRCVRALGAVLQRGEPAAVRVPTRVMATHYPGAWVRVFRVREARGLSARWRESGAALRQLVACQKARLGCVKCSSACVSLARPTPTQTQLHLTGGGAGYRRRRALRGARGQRRRRRPHRTSSLVVHRVLQRRLAPGARRRAALPRGRTQRGQRVRRRACGSRRRGRRERRRRRRRWSGARRSSGRAWRR